MKYLHYILDLFPLAFTAIFTILFLWMAIFGGEVSVKLNGFWPTVKGLWK